MCQVQLHAHCQRLTGRHSYGAVVGLEHLRAARVATPAFQVVWSALHYAYVMAALVMRNIHVDTAADLGLGQITLKASRPLIRVFVINDNRYGLTILF
jgi:hypothetical protein